MSRSIRRMTGQFEAVSRRMPQHEVVPFQRPQKTSIARAIMGSEQYLRQKEILERNRAGRPEEALPDLDKKGQFTMALPASAFKQATVETKEHIDNIFSSAFAHIRPGQKLTY